MLYFIQTFYVLWQESLYLLQNILKHFEYLSYSTHCVIYKLSSFGAYLPLPRCFIRNNKLGDEMASAARNRYNAVDK